MNIIIAGIGKTGTALSRVLSQRGHEVVAIDLEAEVLERHSERFDIMPVQGNCLTAAALSEAGIERAQVLIAVTGSDETNLLCCLIARRMNGALHTIPRVRNPEYLEQIELMREDFGVSLTLNPDKDAATEIYKAIKLPGFLKRESFAKGKVEIVELRIEEGSPLANASMKDLNKIMGCKVLVCAITRGEKTFIPGGADVIMAEDHIFVTAPVAVLSLLMSNLGITSKKVHNVMIIGGGRIGFYLAQMLLKDGVRVKIIDSNRERALHLANELENAVVVCADGSSQELLEMESISDTDSLVTLTGFDEINVMVSVFGASMGVKNIITKINRIESTNLFERMGAGTLINSARLSERYVARYISAMQNRIDEAAITSHAIANEAAEAIEFLVEEDTLYRDTPLKDIPIRKNTLISCINHNGSNIIPDGTSSFTLGDPIIVVGLGDDEISSLNEIFI